MKPDVENIPTAMLTQLGPVTCIPRQARGAGSRRDVVSKAVKRLQVPEDVVSKEVKRPQVSDKEK